MTANFFSNSQCMQYLQGMKRDKWLLPNHVNNHFESLSKYPFVYLLLSRLDGIFWWGFMGHGVGRTKETLMFWGFPFSSSLFCQPMQMYMVKIIPMTKVTSGIEDVYIYIHSYTKKAVLCSPTQQSHPATTLRANKPQVGCQAITAVCTGSGAAKPGWLLPLCTEQGSAGLAMLLHWRLLSQATCTPGSWVITVTNKCCEKNSTYYFFQELPWHWCWF